MKSKEGMSNLFLILLHCAVGIGLVRPNKLWAPPKRVPGNDRGCVQGSEVMGGSFANLPPCPPWRDELGKCHVGDTILLRLQCLDIMTVEEYNNLPQRQPLALSLPPSPPIPQEIADVPANPPGWGAGSPPGSWPLSRPPGTPIGHQGPPGTKIIDDFKSEEVLPPGVKNYRWSLRRTSRGRSASGRSRSVSGRGKSKRGKDLAKNVRAPAPQAPGINQIQRTRRRKERKRKRLSRKPARLRNNRRSRRLRSRKQRKLRRRRKQVRERLEAPPKDVKRS